MSGSLTSRAISYIKKDKLAIISIIIVAIYIVIAILSFFGLIAKGYDIGSNEAYKPPSLSHLFGTDFLGRDVFKRVIIGSKIAISVGVITTAIAIPIGIFFGSIAGYFRGKIDEIIVWFYSTLDSIPYLILLLALTIILGKGLFSVYIALGLTSWVGICRIVRAEVIKQKELDYVQSALSIGSSHFRVIFRHILPNVFHLVIVNGSLLFVSAIKAEVILSYLGVGAQSEPSWGVMISDARMELIGRAVWWQLAGATVAMLIIILAFNMVADTMRDALDPKLNKK